MAGSRSHSRNASQTRTAAGAGDGDDSVLGAVLDVSLNPLHHSLVTLPQILD